MRVRAGARADASVFSKVIDRVQMNSEMDAPNAEKNEDKTINQMHTDNEHLTKIVEKKKGTQINAYVFV